MLKSHALSFGISALGAAACFLLPAYCVNPQVGSGFVLVAFTITWCWAAWAASWGLVGGLLIGVVESIGELFLGDSLGQMGILRSSSRCCCFARRELFGSEGLRGMNRDLVLNCVVRGGAGRVGDVR